MTGGKTINLVLKKMLELFLKIQENIRISILVEIKTNKQKALTFVLTLDDGSWKAKNVPKTFFKVFNGQNIQNQTRFELYKLII